MSARWLAGTPKTPSSPARDARSKTRSISPVVFEKILSSNGNVAKRGASGAIGVPASTMLEPGLVGRTPVGVQVVSGRYREDLCLLAGEAIEAGGVPPSPIDPVS